MDFPFTLINLAGTIALLLWGVRMVQTGVQRAFGPRLRQILGSALRNRFQACLAGLGVTAILQSSTATGLMTAGFAAAGLVDLVPALAVMLGANIGTTLIVQVMSFDVAALSPALFLAGLLMFRRSASTRTRDLGRVAIGIGLMLLSLHQLLELVSPYEDVPSLRLMLGAVSTNPVLDVLLGAIVTWAAHSSVAVVLLIMSLASKGAVPPYAAFALVLGANIGTALNPVLEGGGEDAIARRLPVGNLLNRIIGCAIALAALTPLSRWMVTLEPDIARSVADFHTAFNLVFAAIFFPLLDPFATLLRRWFPDKVIANDPGRPLYLNAAITEVPSLAIGAAAREALRLADLLEAMLISARDAFHTDDRRQITVVRHMDDVLDRLNTAIKAFLGALDRESMDEADHQRVEEILIFALNLGQAGDIIETSLMDSAAKRLKRGLTLPETEASQLADCQTRLITNLHSAASVFMTDDVRAARLLAAEKEAFRDIEDNATQAYFDRLRTEQGEAPAHALNLDILRDLKQVNAHLVAAAAYPVLKSRGDLLTSRLKADP
jgi:phosphate:Na+ symporter